MATYTRSKFFAWQKRLSACWRYGEKINWGQRLGLSRSCASEKLRFIFRRRYPVMVLTGLYSALVAQPNSKEEKGEEKESPVIMMFKMARLAQMKQEEDKAESYLHKALIAADNEFKHNRMSKIDYTYARVNVFDSLANIAFSRGEFTKAEKLYKETMKGCLEVGLEKNDNAIVEISIKLASIYAMQKREDEAVQGYEFCIETQNKKLDKDPNVDVDTLALLGMALEGYGRYLLYHGQLDKSLIMLARAVDIAKKSVGENGPQTLVLMNDLATVHILKKDFDKAEEVIKRAIKTGETVDSSHCAALYCNLGAVYLRKSQLSDTELACQQGLKLAKKYTNKTAMEQAKICLKKVKELQQKGF